MPTNKCTIKDWSQDQIDNYVEQWKEKTASELATIYGVSRRTIGNINKKFGLTRDEDWKSKEASVTYVLRPRKKYRKKSDAAPVGTIQTYKCNGKFESWILTSGGREKLHIHNWKQAGNDIPLGYILGFKDMTLQNPGKSNLDNLVLKTRMSVILENIKFRKPKKDKIPAFKIDIAKKKAAERVEAEKFKSHQRKIQRHKDSKEKKEARATDIANRKAERTRIREYQHKERIRKQELSNSRERHLNRPRRKEKTFKTKPVDLSKLFPVRIDHRTIVYAKSLADIPRIIAKYSKAG